MVARCAWGFGFEVFEDGVGARCACAAPVVCLLSLCLRRWIFSVLFVCEVVVVRLLAVGPFLVPFVCEVLVVRTLATVPFLDFFVVY